MTNTVTYRVIDSQTKQALPKVYGDLEGRKARKRAERLNQQYGAVRYFCKMEVANND